MNKTIQNLKYEDLLFVDCETVRGSEVFDTDHPYYDVWAWKQRNTETNEIPDSKDVIQSYYNKAALFPEWGRIVCISIGYIHNEELHIKSFTGEEADILTSFVEAVQKTGRKLVAHNISFDIPYIRKRYFINRLPVNEYLTETQGLDVGMKIWDLEKVLFDTMALWKGVNWANTSLDELAMCFGIPSSKQGEVSGANVGDAFYAGRIQEIAEYCEKDVAVVANLIRLWKGDSILEAISKPSEELKQKNVLEQAYASKELTETLKQQLEAVLQKKRKTKKDKDIISDILTNLLIKTELGNSDSTKEQERKQKEVEQFITNL